MVHPDTYTSATPKGVALFAKRGFKKGEILWVADAADNVMPYENFLKLPQREQKRMSHYCYVDSQQRIIVPSDNGKYVNHSCAPNATYLIEFDNVSIALRDIEADEEITEDYRCYFNHLSDFDCQCGAKNCVGTLRKNDGFCTAHRLRLGEVATLITKHPQPLLRDNFQGKKQFLNLLKQEIYEYC